MTNILLTILVSCVASLLVLVLVSGGSPTTDAAEVVLDLPKLQQLIVELRGNGNGISIGNGNGNEIDDDRLIRLVGTPSSQQEVCSSMIPSLVQTLAGVNNNAFKERGLSAEVIGLCCTGNPTNRADAGLHNPLIFSGLKDLITTGMELFLSTNPTQNLDLSNLKKDTKQIYDDVGTVIGQASELIWILSYNNEHNQHGLFDAGIIDELVTSLKKLPVLFSDDGPFSHTNMWSLAALANLAATYCNSESGYCDWKPNNDTHRLELPAGITPRSLSSRTGVSAKIRTKIMEYVQEKDDLGFGKLLVYMVCNGPVSSPHDATYSWPSQALYSRSKTHPEIVPWAATSLFKNLVLDDNARRYFSEQTEDNRHLFMCLCNMYKNTPDTIELDMATSAVQRMNWDAHCPSVYDRCKDKVPNWTENITKKSCSDYETERLCATQMGGKIGTNGLTASEGCCVCGGGIREGGGGGGSCGGGGGGDSKSREFQQFIRMMEHTPSSGGSCGSF